MSHHHSGRAKSREGDPHVDRKCSVAGCLEPSVCRGFCRPHYRAARKSGELAVSSRSNLHSLTEIDRDAAHAVCAICGPTRIRVRRDRKTPECWAVRQRNSNPSPARKRRRVLANYGMTTAEYEALLTSQGGRCATCRRKPTANGKAFAVDHCHKTGQVRGIVCSACNTAMGLAGDSAKVLQAMADYLHRAEQGALFWAGPVRDPWESAA